jgi:hypothetical protein
MLLIYCNLNTYDFGFFFFYGLFRFCCIWLNLFSFLFLTMLHVFSYYIFDEIFVYTFIFLSHLGFYFYLFFGSHVLFSPCCCVFIVFNFLIIIVDVRGFYIYILMCYYELGSFFVSGKNQTISAISLAL